MKSIQNFTAIIEREDEGYVALFPELDVASQGDTVEEAKKNLLITDLYRCGRKAVT